jgi:2-methylcitrate dehydratase PrpD
MRVHGELAPLHSGLAARAGVEAALLAQDADAGEFVLEGNDGQPGAIALLRGDVARIVPEAWDGATIADVAWKFFPACFGSITALEGILRLGPVDAATLRSLRLRLPDRMLALVADGPKSGHLYDRLMSLRWAAARTLLSGSFAAVDAGRDGPDVMELARKIEIIHDAQLDSLTAELAADVEMTTDDGCTRRIAYRRAIGDEPGSPGARGWTRMLDEAALLGKFRSLAGTDPAHEATLRALG